jgi:hypothetical protein
MSSIDIPGIELRSSSDKKNKKLILYGILAFAGIVLIVLVIVVIIVALRSDSGGATTTSPPITTTTSPPNTTTTSPPTTTTPPIDTIFYGNIIKLQINPNVSNLVPSDRFVSTCGGSPNECGSYNVTLRTDPQAESGNSIRWKIEQFGSTSTTTAVKYGDIVQLANVYDPTAYMESCGGTSDQCGINVMAKRTNYLEAARKWTIEGGTTGTFVKKDDLVKLKNGFNSLFLSACGAHGVTTGSTCGINVSLRENDLNEYNEIIKWKMIRD